MNAVVRLRGGGAPNMYFQLDANFRSHLPKGTATCTVNATYLDDVAGRSWTLVYGTGTTDRKVMSKKGGNTWVTASVTAPCSKLTGALGGISADIELQANGNHDTTFHMVEVRVDSR